MPKPKKTTIKDGPISATGVLKGGVLKLSGLPINVYTADEIEISNGKVDECMGAAQYYGQRILIDRGMEKQLREVILLHEAIHIISSIHDLKLNESQVNELGNSFYDLIENNPKWRGLVG